MQEFPGYKREYYNYIPPLTPVKPLDENLMIFRSFPDYSGNPLAFYEYVKKNTNYDAIWAIRDEQTYHDLKAMGIPCFWLYDRREGYKWFSKARYVIFSYDIDCAYPKLKGQVYAHLGQTLGTALDGFAAADLDERALLCMKWLSTSSDILTASSFLMKTTTAGQILMDGRKIFVTGEPRCDLLFQENGMENLLRLIPSLKTEYTKYIFYAPTARRHPWLPQFGEDFKNNIFNFDSFDRERFANFLAANNACFIMKLHPQDENHLQADIASQLPEHCFILSTHAMAKEGLSVYHILNAFDIMVGDVSSLTHEYLLLNRPIVRVCPDIEEIIKVYTLGFGDFDLWFAGDKVNNQDEFEAALGLVIKQPSHLQKERELIRKFLFTYVDDKACERVLDVLVNYKPINNIEYEMYTEPMKSWKYHIRNNLVFRHLAVLKNNFLLRKKKLS